MSDDQVLMNAPAGCGMLSFSDGSKATIDVSTGTFQCPRKYVREALNMGCAVAGPAHAPWGAPHA